MLWEREKVLELVRHSIFLLCFNESYIQALHQFLFISLYALYIFVILHVEDITE